MAEMDEKMRDMALKALSGNANGRQAYLLLDVSGRRMGASQPGPTAQPESRTVESIPGPEAMARDFIKGDDSCLDDCISTARAAISELHAASSGACRQKIEDWAGNLASVI